MKKGFTLVELLAVIVILAVILVIAVPQINSVIKQTKKNSLASTAKLIAAKVEEKQVENEALENNEVLTCSDLVKLDSNYGNCTVSIVNGKGTVTINGAGKFAGITCTGTKDNMTCSEGVEGEVATVLDAFQYDISYTVLDKEECNEKLPMLTSSGGTNITKICNGESPQLSTALDYYKRGYIYKVTDKEKCKSYFLAHATEEEINSSEAQEQLDAICTIYDDDEYVNEISIMFSSAIEGGKFTYDDISSFVSKGENPIDEFLSIDGITIYGYDVSIGGTDVVIPNKIEGFDVVTIDNKAFMNLGITSVVLPNKLEHIGYSSFQNNNLTNIEIPSSVIYIGEYAFIENNLNTVTLHNTDIYIDNCAFGNSDDMVDHNLPNTYSCVEHIYE